MVEGTEMQAVGIQGSVLLVDDEESILKFLSRLLEQRNYKVEVALSGFAALKRLEDGDIDILATDLMMPGMDGVELIGRAKALYPELQCMMMTGHGEVESAVLAMERGAFNYLLKPIDVDALDMVLRVGMERVGLIAARKWAEEENARLSSAVEHASEAILICGLAFEVNYVNPAFSNLVQFSLEDVASLSFLGLLADGQEDILTVLRGMMDTSQTWKGEVKVKNMDGQSVLTEMSVSPLSDDMGKHNGCIIMLRDVREAHALREKLKEKERIDSIGMLAGGIAHDFNNLLTTIMGNAELLQLKSGNDPLMLRYVDRIRHAGQSAAELCQMLLSYAGKGQYVVQQVDLSKAVEEALHLMDTAVPKHIRMHMKLPTEALNFEADKTQVHQLVISLMMNAIESIEDREGDIILETGKINISSHHLSEWIFGDEPESKAGEYVFLRVTDTGCGMDKSTQDKMFEPFFSTKFTGRGLGLSAVAGVMKAAQGLIEMQSTEHEGTSMTLAFPWQGEETDVGGVSDVSDVSSFDIRFGQPEIEIGDIILIVDDDEDILDIMDVSLQDLGYETLTAFDGENAVRMYEANQEHIVGVLMDMTMPNMNGDKAFLKMAEINQDVKVILSSGYTETEIMTKCGFESAVPAGFLQKPYSISELQRFVQKIFKKRRALKQDSNA
ncbi:MAG: response regulator [Mariprofundaceae bacterium]|nr:response regulator [Mariprofundaceae bacterium]